MTKNKKKIFNEETASDKELFDKYIEGKNSDPLRYIKIMRGRNEGTAMPKDYPRYQWDLGENELVNINAVDEFGNRERFTDKIQKQGKYEVKPKKKIKKVADSSLVSPQKPLPFNLDRFLDELHPMWWEIEHDKPLTDDEKAKLRFERLKRLAEERLMAKGIGNLLSINRYKYE